VGVTVSVNNPSFPEGTEFAIDHLGVVPNGGSLEVPEENEAMFVSARGMSVEDAFKDNEVIEVSGSATAEVPQGVSSEEQEQTTQAEAANKGQEAPQTTEGSEGEVS
jgi:hypothetical protein